jgi:pimeloyl-ACP methyl ester carboxylesterase
VRWCRATRHAPGPVGGDGRGVGRGGRRVRIALVVRVGNRVGVPVDDDATIPVRAIVVEATTSTPAEAPLVLLSGGPGGSAVTDAVVFLERFGAMRPEHDLVFVEQRGTGASGAVLCDPLGLHQVDAAIAGGQRDDEFGPAGSLRRRRARRRAERQLVPRRRRPRIAACGVRGRDRHIPDARRRTRRDSAALNREPPGRPLNGS